MTVTGIVLPSIDLGLDQQPVAAPPPQAEDTTGRSWKKMMRQYGGTSDFAKSYFKQKTTQDIIRESAPALALGALSLGLPFGVPFGAYPQPQPEPKPPATMPPADD